jgi:hypothetical protein
MFPLYVCCSTDKIYFTQATHANYEYNEFKRHNHFITLQVFDARRPYVFQQKPHLFSDFVHSENKTASSCHLKCKNFTLIPVTQPLLPAFHKYFNRIEFTVSHKLSAPDMLTAVQEVDLQE